RRRHGRRWRIRTRRIRRDRRIRRRRRVRPEGALTAMRRLPRRLATGGAVAALAVVMIAVFASPARAHDERPSVPVSGNGHVPEYRTSGPTELVCKTDAADFARRLGGYPDALKARNEQLFAQCQKDGFRDLQAAVDAVHTAGVRILMLPGVYQELPSFAPP